MWISKNQLDNRMGNLGVPANANEDDTENEEWLYSSAKICFSVALLVLEICGVWSLVAMQATYFHTSLRNYKITSFSKIFYSFKQIISDSKLDCSKEVYIEIVWLAKKL